MCCFTSPPIRSSRHRDARAGSLYQVDEIRREAGLGARQRSNCALRFSVQHDSTTALAQLPRPSLRETHDPESSRSRGRCVNWFVAQVRDRKDSSPVATLFELALSFSPFFYENEKLLTGGLKSSKPASSLFAFQSRESGRRSGYSVASLGHSRNILDRSNSTLRWTMLSRSNPHNWFGCDISTLNNSALSSSGPLNENRVTKPAN